MSERILQVAPSLSVGWEYIDKIRKDGDPSKIHAVFQSGKGMCHRSSPFMDSCREMSASEFMEHNARCLSCVKLLAPLVASENMTEQGSG